MPGLSEDQYIPYGTRQSSFFMFQLSQYQILLLDSKRSAEIFMHSGRSAIKWHIRTVLKSSYFTECHVFLCLQLCLSEMLHAGDRRRISLLGAEHDSCFLEGSTLHGAFSSTRCSAFNQRCLMMCTDNPG